MKRILPLVLLVLSAMPARAGKIVTDTLRSNILGADVVYNVYLPDGFSKSADKYPAVYLLHGLYGVYSDWETRGRMKEVADEFIRSGEIRKMIIIMPNAGHADVRNEWNGYFNMPGWNYEDFFFQEFIPVVEKKYRAVGDKGHRAIMGLSMGGGGSTVYAQRHPDMFSSCYAMSAWLDQVVDENDPKDKLYYTRKSVREHSALDFVASADEATIKKLRSVSWFIDCGDDDFLLDLSVELYKRMRAAKIKSELRVRDGVHNWEYWHLALRMALPFASRNFEP